MADGLQPGGVDLRVAGFDSYIRKLQQIDKQQREVFEKKYKDTDLSYRQIVAASKQYQRELNNESKALQRAERERAKLAEQAQKEAERAAKAQQKAARDRTAGANLAFTGIAAGLTVAAVKGLDLAKQGAAFEAQEQAAFNLAASYGQLSSEIIAAMQKASNGVLSNSDIIQAANKALLLEVAKTPDEFDRVTRNAIVLGRTLGLTATESIDQFTTALGRKSILILDNFGLKMAQVNEELDRLGRQQFGKGLADLSTAQKDALFIEAALAAADKRVEAIGDNGDSAAAQIERMGAAAENAKTQFALLLKDLGQSSGLFAGLANATQNIADSIQGSRVGFGGGSLQDQIAVTKQQIEELKKLQEEGPAKFTDGWGVLNQARAAFAAPNGPTTEDQIKSLETKLQALLQTEKSQAEAVAQSTSATKENTDAVEENEKAIKQQQQAIRQAEQIALNFARAQQDAARNLQRSQQRLEEQQAKARDKALQSQQKQLDKFEQDAIKDRTKAQAEAAKRETELRKNAGKQQADDQRKLLLDLKQAEERFNLDRIQSRRRFNLSDRRLRAEGDILGLQALREDFELQQTENRENFDLQKKQTKDSAAEQRQQQARDNAEQLAELQRGLAEQNAEFEAGLNERRAELLTSFDEQFADLQTSQQEQRDELQRNYQQQLEDLNLNRDRQLEDLGRSYVEMEGITQEGAQKLSDQLEKAFGIDGTADLIMQGFATRQASSFEKLFNDISGGLRDLTPAATPTPGTAPSRRGRLSFADGGIVPGSPGQAVPIIAHAGEAILNQGQQQQVMQMLAPVVSSQTLDVRISGGYKITGSAAPAAEIQQAMQMDTAEAVRIALQRVKRRG